MNHVTLTFSERHIQYVLSSIRHGDLTRYFKLIKELEKKASLKLPTDLITVDVPADLVVRVYRATSDRPEGQVKILNQELDDSLKTQIGAILGNPLHPQLAAAQEILKGVQQKTKENNDTIEHEIVLAREWLNAQN